MIKVKISIGSARISAEGELAEIEKILKEYWEPIISNSAIQLASHTRQAAPSSPDAKTTAKPKQRKRNKTSNGETPNNAPTIDAQNLANKIKESTQFSRIKTKILDVPGDWINKCKLVSAFAGEPITSGDVHRTMENLKIKSSLSTLSKTLSGNSTDFLTKGSNPVIYEMTATAESAFKNWLESDDE